MTGLAAFDEVKDHFVVHQGVRCAGVHLIIDVYKAPPVRLGDEGFLDETLRRCVDASGATLLHLHLHTFGDGGGVSGVAVLAESHISIHTWPEREYAALDVFMCGTADAEAVPPVLRDAFGPKSNVMVKKMLRGTKT